MAEPVLHGPAVAARSLAARPARHTSAAPSPAASRTPGRSRATPASAHGSIGHRRRRSAAAPASPGERVQRPRSAPVASSSAVEAGAAVRSIPMSCTLALARPRRRREMAAENSRCAALSAQDRPHHDAPASRRSARPPEPGAVGVGSGERVVDLAHTASGAFGLAVVPNVRVSMNVLVRLSLAQASAGSVIVAAFCSVPRITRGCSACRYSARSDRHPHDPAAHDPPGHRARGRTSRRHPGRDRTGSCTGRGLGHAIHLSPGRPRSGFSRADHPVKNVRASRPPR